MEVDAIKKQAIRCLISTDALVKQLGAKWDGPRFRFNCQLHRSPSPRWLHTLAEKYTMELLIPNALIAYSFGKKPDDSWLDALDYCMRTNKAPKTVAAWDAIKGDPRVLREAVNAWNFFVLGRKVDGNLQGAGKPFTLKGYLGYKTVHITMHNRCLDKNKKPKAEAEAEKLLKRSKNEPELLAANREGLMKMGISRRTAAAFIKLRNDRKGELINGNPNRKTHRDNRNAGRNKCKGERRLSSGESGIQPALLAAPDTNREEQVA
jgi:hypothetical protein